MNFINLAESVALEPMGDLGISICLGSESDVDGFILLADEPGSGLLLLSSSSEDRSICSFGFVSSEILLLLVGEYRPEVSSGSALGVMNTLPGKPRPLSNLKAFSISYFRTN